MQIILDHLASIFIGAVILLIVVYIQLRGSLGAAESTINHLVYSEALHVNQLLERDLENMLTRAQVNQASSFTGGSGTFACSLHTQNGRADTLTFATLADPAVTMNSVGDPTNTAAIEVQYILEPAGDSISVTTGNTTQLLPLFVLNRYVGGVITANSLPYVTHFEVTFGMQGNSLFIPTDLQANTTTLCEPNIAKVRYDFKLVAEGIDFISLDQKSTSNLNVSRFGSTVNLSNWE